MCVHVCEFLVLILSDIWLEQMEKIPLDDVKKDLRSAELSEEVVEELLQVLSVKSLAELEGWLV